jgi:hypothetical protein
LLIALEGEPYFPGTLENPDVLKLHDPSESMIAVPYVRNGSEVEGAVIKYHPRREGYDPEAVNQDIVRHARRLVLIDSLNAVHWEPKAYLELAKVNPQVTFIMCHAGGYDIVEFVKMCRFLPNVWLDFSVTQHEFGWVSNRRSPGYISEVIDHALNERRIAPKLLFGSDFPLLEDPEPFLTGNFERLLNSCGL